MDGLERVHNLRGLLKFCVEATKKEDPTQEVEQAELSEDKKEFLRGVFRDMTVNVIESLAECINTLSQTEKIMDPDCQDLSEQLDAFETVENYCGEIDMANNFHKIGGFEALKICLSSPHDEIVQACCNAIAELAQNNDYCSEKLIEDDFLPKLVSRLSEDNSDGNKKKAMYAISCIARENPVGLQKLSTVLMPYSRLWMARVRRSGSKSASSRRRQ